MTHRRCYAEFCLVPLLLVLTACAPRRDDQSPKPKPAEEPAELRVHLASDQPQPGFDEATDPQGRRIYVAPQPELTNADMLEAQALTSRRNSMLQIVLNPLGTERLRQLTTAHLGARIAVFIDGELVSAPTINSPVSGGRIQILGRYTQDQAEKTAAALNRRAQLQPAHEIEQRDANP